MTDKNGTPQHHRSMEFEKTPATGMSTCPFKSLEVAIVPVRYALDRSRYDVAPEKLKPLPKTGKWAELPELKTRAYTLRQLYDGYVYVFDETARTFHEYTVNAADATLTRIVWTAAQLGEDTRSGTGDAKPYLLYPRTNRLHLAFSPMQWTWRLCEHMRSNADSRAKWMKAIDLSACITMAEPDTLPLKRIAEAVADIDAGAAMQDKRFADSSVPTSSDDSAASVTEVNCKPLYSPVGCDAYWLGSAPDRDSAVFIALDDPLAVLNDLGLQLAADQAAYQVWQTAHGHKLEMAKTVTNLCASSDNPDGLPASVKGDVRRTQAYLGEVDSYLDKAQQEEVVLNGPGASSAYMDPNFFSSPEMKRALQDKYGTAPDTETYESWKKREKWRREIDLRGARAYISQHQPTADTLLQQIRDTQADFREWSEHIGLDPAVLFVDTTNVKSLLYLQTVMSELLTVYTQGVGAHDWLLEQEKNASSLFGTLRYGFSPAIKEALHQEADQLLKGMNDFTNLATRVGELNAALNHPDVGEQAWMKKLSQTARDTYSALRQLASGKGKGVAESIMIALIPVDARQSTGKSKDLVTLIRNLLVGSVLLDPSLKWAIDKDIGDKLKTWKRQQRVLDKKLNDLRRNWVYPHTNYDRRSLSRQIAQVSDELEKHHLKIPLLLDFQEKHYALALQHEMQAYLQSGVKTLKAWEARVKEWLYKLGATVVASITWGVIMLNFINTAVLYDDLTRDGEFSGQDMVKVGYGLGYSVNLLIGVFVETPWAFVKAALPVIIDDVPIGILQRSSAYWIKRGDVTWGNAVKSFRIGMIAMGAAGMIAAALELNDLLNDYDKSKTDGEKYAIATKFMAVSFMFAGSAIQLAAGLFPKTLFATAVLSSWFTIILFAAGLIYLLATSVMNYFQMDSVGWWLRRSTWSVSSKERYANDASGQEEELSELLKIHMSPGIFVKRTRETQPAWSGKYDYHAPKLQNGAWIQIFLPSAIRGKTISFNIVSSERPFGILPVERSEGSITDSFLDNGEFWSNVSFGTTPNTKPAMSQEKVYFPKIPPATEGITWQSWVPLSTNARFIELQIWYPDHESGLNPKSKGYLFQIKLEDEGDHAMDGLIKSKLPVEAQGRNWATSLEIPLSLRAGSM